MHKACTLTVLCISPQGFAFLKYQDQRSTILAVDNLNNATVLGRTIRVDHVDKYKQEEEEEDDDKKKKRKKKKSGADAKEWSHDMAEGLEALGNPKPAGPQDADEAWEREFAQMNAHTQELNAGDKKEKKEKKEKKKEKKEKKKEKKQEKKERKEAERDTQEEAPQPPAAPTPEPVTMAESVRRRDRSRSHDRRRDRSHSHDRRRDRSRSYDRRRHRSRSHDRRRDRSRDRRRDGRSPGRGDHRREDHRDTEREDHRKGQSSRRSDERDADNAARAHQAQLSILDDALANL